RGSEPMKFDEETFNNSDSYKLGYAALFFATLAVASYWLLRYFVDSSYPSPSSEYASVAGLFYLVTVSLAALLGVPFLLMRLFPTLRRALASRKSFARIAIIIGAAYFVTYLILVNQIVITGFNTPPSNYIPSPTGSYPFAFIFASGPSPSSALESAFYVPQITVQLNPYINLLLMPFEMILAIALSSLLASSVIVTYFLIGSSSKHSCFTGATVSALGGFFGFTATCPMCLVPTLVSVFLGGVSATVPSFYSHIAGVVIPPLVSVSALLAGITYLNFQFFRVAGTSKSIITALPEGSKH
ncbi:MAG: hypothetical protein ACREBS_10625, partial [Nitrososphaerales archaeon]